MNVAMWTSREARCGIASYSAELTRELRALGAAVELVPVPYTDRDPARAAAALGRLNAADVVHVQHEYTFFGGVAPRASSLAGYYRALRRPRVVTAHTAFSAAELLRLPQETRRRQRLAKRILASLPSYRHSVERAPFLGAEAVVVHTAAAAAEMVRRGVPREQVHVLTAGIPSPARTDPGRAAALRARLGLAGKRLLTIFGYVTPEKGYETALDAVRSLPPGVDLLVAGGARVERERGHVEALREAIRRRGLEGRAAISGYLEEEEIAAAMELTDLVLAPHTAANGSYSVMVALSYGKPVLASNLACFLELAEQERCLELFDAGDEGMLAERAAFLLASGGARRALAERARDFAARRSWASVARSTLAVYEAVLRR